MDPVGYSPKQVDLLVDAITVLLPVSTGFILLVGAGLPRLFEAGVLQVRSNRILVVCSLGLAVASIGLWSGSLAFLVDCAHAFERPVGTPGAIGIALLNWEWGGAVRCAQAALVCFLLAAASYAVVGYRGLAALSRSPK